MVRDLRMDVPCVKCGSTIIIVDDESDTASACRCKGCGHIVGIWSDVKIYGRYRTKDGRRSA